LVIRRIRLEDRYGRTQHPGTDTPRLPVADDGLCAGLVRSCAMRSMPLPVCPGSVSSDAVGSRPFLLIRSKSICGAFRLIRHNRNSVSGVKVCGTCGSDDVRCLVRRSPQGPPQEPDFLRHCLFPETPPHFALNKLRPVLYARLSRLSRVL
jgi:hypothetical protein